MNGLNRGYENFLHLACATEEKGRISCREWEKYDSLNVVYQPKLMSVEELKQGMRKVWRDELAISQTNEKMVDFFLGYIAPAIFATAFMAVVEGYFLL